MSLTTWTPTAVSSEAYPLSCRVWRMVEAQHVVSTSRILDTREEQELLEDILEESKPPVPPEAQGLDYLLYSPFRYGPLSPYGSRFRGVADSGVFYGAETVRTAAAEVGYWRWHFLQDSSGLDRLPPCSFTAFKVPLKTSAVDLRKPPFDREAAVWQHTSDYSATQAFGRVARSAGIGAILYLSVRDPEPHFCAAVLTPRAFAVKKPDRATQTWVLTVSEKEAIWMRQGEEGFSFQTSMWAESQ